MVHSKDYSVSSLISSQRTSKATDKLPDCPSNSWTLFPQHPQSYLQILPPHRYARKEEEKWKKKKVQENADHVKKQRKFRTYYIIKRSRKPLLPHSLLSLSSNEQLRKIWEDDCRPRHRRRRRRPRSFSQNEKYHHLLITKLVASCFYSLVVPKKSFHSYCANP